MRDKDLEAMSSYQFDLPEELIAQKPCSPRDASRLMVVDRASGEIFEMPFHEIVHLFEEGDGLVFNDTKVIPSRLIGKKESGGAVEIFLTQPYSDGTWEALAKPGRRLHSGTRVFFGDDFFCEILETLPDGGKRVKLSCDGDIDSALLKYGKIPLPHYIKEGENPLAHLDWYQTVYAKSSGAVAAPTAGLHFTNNLLKELDALGVSQTYVTLHVGVGTFRPVKVENIRNHVMHKEKFVISNEAAKQLNSRPLDKLQICVGTTCCRTLESAVSNQGLILPGEKSTDIFIYPGYSFKYVKSMLTNFHLPGSTLLMLVSAFAGHDLMMEAYAKAVKDKFRFFSYGDAMLIL